MGEGTGVSVGTGVGTGEGVSVGRAVGVSGGTGVGAVIAVGSGPLWQAISPKTINIAPRMTSKDELADLRIIVTKYHDQTSFAIIGADKPLCRSNQLFKDVTMASHACL